MTWKLACGSYTLFVIEDGYYWRDPATYYAQASDHDWRFHQRDDAGRARLNFGCYLITDGDRTIIRNDETERLRRNADDPVDRPPDRTREERLMSQPIERFGVISGMIETAENLARYVADLKVVRSTPPLAMNTWVALVSATKPWRSSISASSAPAALASILARIDWMRLQWWIFGSRQSGGKRRTELVISVRPLLS